MCMVELNLNIFELLQFPVAIRWLTLTPSSTSAVKMILQIAQLTELQQRVPAQKGICNDKLLILASFFYLLPRFVNLSRVSCH